MRRDGPTCAWQGPIYHASVELYVDLPTPHDDALLPRAVAAFPVELTVRAAPVAANFALNTASRCRYVLSPAQPELGAAAATDVDLWRGRRRCRGCPYLEADP